MHPITVTTAIISILVIGHIPLLFLLSDTKEIKTSCFDIYSAKIDSVTCTKTISASHYVNNSLDYLMIITLISIMILAFVTLKYEYN